MIQKYNAESSLVTEHVTPFISFSAFENFDCIRAGFSTRLGGVSIDHLKSLNLGFQLEESRDNVLENYRRICDAIGISPRQLVLTRQTHETVVLQVGKKDCGKGIFRESDYASADSLITNEQGVALTVFGADCVPIIFFDPVKRVIATAHAGWRGTAGNIAGKAVESFVTNYGSNASDIIAVIGPSICPDCYEVSEDVAEKIIELFPDALTKEYGAGKNYKSSSILLKDRDKGKFQLNLWLANRINMINSGMLEENIHLCGLCTMCRQDLFYSHRGSNGKRGVTGGFIMLKEDGENVYGR